MCHIVGTRWVGWMNWTYLYTSMSVNKKLERGEQQANDYSVKDNEHVNTVSTWEYGIRNATSRSHTYLSTQNMVKKENLKMANSTKMTQKALTERKMTETKNNKWKPFKIHTGIQSISCWFLFCLFFFVLFGGFIVMALDNDTSAPKQTNRKKKMEMKMNVKMRQELVHHETSSYPKRTYKIVLQLILSTFS